MNNSRLVNVLRTFSKAEMKEFEKFVSSSYFNKGRNYVPFLAAIRKFHPKFDNEKLTPEYIYSKMYPGKKFNRQIMWNMTSQMLNMAENFLMHISLRRNKFIKEQMIAEEFLERRLSQFYQRKLDDMESALDKMGLDENYFRYKTQVEMGRMAYHFFEDTPFLVAEHVMKKGEYSIMNFMRDISDVIAALNASSNMYNQNFEVSAPNEFIQNLQLNNVIDFAYKNNFKYAPILELYCRTIMMTVDFEKTEHFFRLQELFEQNYNLFTASEKFFWAAELSNYAIQKVKAGVAEFKKIIFEMDKFKLKEGMLYTEKYLPKVLFIQILANATRAKEIEWAKGFVEEYAPKLKPAYQKPMRALAYASVYFRIKDYDKALENLSKVKFIDSMDKLYVRFFYIRIYYDLNETETLLNYIDSTRHYLSKNVSIGGELRDNYVRFLACLSRLVAAKENKDGFEIEKLSETIKVDSSLPLSEWLAEKIDEIKKGAY